MMAEQEMVSEIAFRFCRRAHGNATPIPQPCRECLREVAGIVESYGAFLAERASR